MSYRKPHQIANAQFLLQVRGVRPAAAYLRTCGFSIEAAFYILSVTQS